MKLMDERDFRPARALTWCAFEGTEIQDAMFAMYRAVELILSCGSDEDAMKIVQIMEEWAAQHAVEIHSGEWCDPTERTNVPIALAHLRETGELHPAIGRKI